MGRIGPNSYTWFPEVDGPVKPTEKPVEAFSTGWKPKPQGVVSKSKIRRREVAAGNWVITPQQWQRIKKCDLPDTFVNDKRAYYRDIYLKSQHWAELRAR